MYAINPISERFLTTAVQAGLYFNKNNLRHHLAVLFEGVELRGARVLDIGGGSGLHSLYAAACGAREVVCLEPEAAGSTANASQHFDEMCPCFGATTARLEPKTLQSYAAPVQSFDLVLLHNSINHLDEQACITLLEDPASRETYVRLFAKIAGLANQGATLIICDCSPHNLFARLGCRNPFLPTIEWHKHHTPETWAALLAEVGFGCPCLRWLSFNRLGAAGRFLLGHRVPAYFLTSYFKLTMCKLNLETSVSTSWP